MAHLYGEPIALDPQSVIDAVDALNARIDAGDERVLAALLAVTARLDEFDRLITAAVLRTVADRIGG